MKEREQKYYQLKLIKFFGDFNSKNILHHVQILIYIT
jgi:hypothetical protein